MKTGKSILILAGCCLVLGLTVCNPQTAVVPSGSEGGVAAAENPNTPLTPVATSSEDVDGGSPTSAAGFPDIIPGIENIDAFDDEELIAVLLADDFDKDGSSDLEEIENETDPEDPRDGGDLDGDNILDIKDSDLDGDGIDNAIDEDVDGDGKQNAVDEDVDGDRTENGQDRDIDGDGIINHDDDDADGDGLLAPEDNDDDGDGIEDDKDDDDDADEVKDCECDHGQCIGGDCLCQAGWEGDTCDKFHCRNVHNCNNGTCVGPNACRCNKGWDSVGSIPCAVYHCRDVRNCSDHGVCTGPDICECEDDWKGRPDCSQHTCAVSPSRCNDNDPCTKDECDPSTGCKHSDLCSSTEVCLQGTCFSVCRNTLDCQSGNACRDGACQDGCFDASDCRDGDPCTDDICNASSDCENSLKTCPGTNEICVRGKCVSACLDNSACDADESCRDDGCFKDCDSDSDCDDGETCTDGACLPPEDDSEDNGG